MGPEPTDILELINWGLQHGYLENQLCCYRGYKNPRLLHDTTKPALVKEQQNNIKSSATALYLKTSALKYRHELNSQNLQNYKAMDFEIHGFFFSLAAATLESALHAAEQNRYIGQDYWFWCFLFQVSKLRSSSGFRKLEWVQNKIDDWVERNYLTDLSVNNQVTTFYTLVSTPLTQNACLHQKYKI